MLIRHLLPTISDLVAHAIADTDFLGDISDNDSDLSHVAANAADLAAEQWEEAHGYPVNLTVPLELLLDTRAALIERARTVLTERATAADDALSDAMAAGDVDSDGEPVGYATYRSC